jgi:hypothetical protein
MLTDAQHEILKVVCAGNADALAFCETLVGWLHWIDDVTDGDHVTPTETIRINLSALIAFGANSFFQAHRTSLMGLLTQACCAWLDSEDWSRRKSAQDRRAADVLKSTYHEVVWHVAYLVGGWNHLRAVTAVCRAYDFEVIL